jgi:hypothetical protein
VPLICKSLFNTLLIVTLTTEVVHAVSLGMLITSSKERDTIFGMSMVPITLLFRDLAKLLNGASRE